MKQVGFVGWRGMVGSVLMQRMREEEDFSLIDPVFFSTSQKGESGPDVGKNVPLLKDAYDLNELAAMDVIVSCQGGDYTNKIAKELRQTGWQG
ncbi:MAG TPA: aspartate-semialdehyde dehydrogenase, partial [Nitrosomonas sp.]|nr:aspartate-semialdehyde dehydrogenase [Nitrosomonas sp.]